MAFESYLAASYVHFCNNRTRTFLPQPQAPNPVVNNAPLAALPLAPPPPPPAPAVQLYDPCSQFGHICWAADTLCVDWLWLAQLMWPRPPLQPRAQYAQHAPCHTSRNWTAQPCGVRRAYFVYFYQCLLLLFCELAIFIFVPQWRVNNLPSWSLRKQVRFPTRGSN